MNTRTKQRKTDSERGDRPYIGYRVDGKQHRFSLGTDPKQAKIREEKIKVLYAESVAARKRYGQQKPSWTEAALYAAKEIASGKDQVEVPSAETLNEVAMANGLEIGEFDCDWTPDNPASIFWSHSVASQLYPSVKWILPQGAIGVRAMEIAKIRYNLNAKKYAKLLNATPPERPVNGTFHEALDRYAAYLQKSLQQKVGPGSLSNRLGYLKSFKIRHEDFELLTLDFNKCDELLSFWSNRPVKTSDLNKEAQNRYSAKQARQRRAELDHFFNWLEVKSGFGWAKPRFFDRIDRSVARDQTRRSIRDLKAKKTFSLDELCRLNEECNTLKRMLLYLGLNCAFGAAESGRLEFEDLFVRERNPLEKYWHNQSFSSGENDSWIAFLRPKTGVAGCWWLFPETVAAIEAWTRMRPKSDSQRLVVTETGMPLYREKSKNAQSGFAKIFNELNKSAIKKSKESSFQKLPFGTLRDQFPDWAVAKGESESGSIALAHGTPFKDDLLLCYANRPFPRLFDVQRRYHEYLKPVFDAAT